MRLLDALRSRSLVTASRRSVVYVAILLLSCLAQVSVVLVAAWQAESRRADLASAFSKCAVEVRLGIWEEAMPMRQDNDGQWRPVARALAQQHRFVVAQELEKHDVFSCWEDDMRITLAHVLHYVRTSRALEEAARTAPGEQLDLEHAREPKVSVNVSRLPKPKAGGNARACDWAVVAVPSVALAFARATQRTFYNAARVPHRIARSATQRTIYNTAHVLHVLFARCSCCCRLMKSCKPHMAV